MLDAFVAYGLRLPEWELSMKKQPKNLRTLIDETHRHVEEIKKLVAKLAAKPKTRKGAR
jgi:hypothetical protein